MRLFTPDTSSFPTFEDKGKFIMAWRFSLIFTLIFSALSAVIIQNTFSGGLLYLFTTLLSAGTLVYLKKTKNYKPVFLVYVISGSAVSQYALFMVHEMVHYADLLWIFTIIVFAFVALGKKEGWIVMCINLVGVALFTLFGKQTTFHEISDSFSVRISLTIEVITVFFILTYLLNQYVIFQNYSKYKLRKLNNDLEHQNEEIIHKNKENITLLKEVHHRVKNNLQIIISLLRMQQLELKSKEAKEQFSIAINRILTMSMIHQKLYQEKEPSMINIPEYVKNLSQELLSMSGKSDLRLNVDASKEFTGLRTVVPIGLLVNELISNSIKHAFSGEEKGEIEITIRSKNTNELLLTYKDNGTWVEPDEEAGGFGLELIDILTEQLDGSYSREGSNYAFTISMWD